MTNHRTMVKESKQVESSNQLKKHQHPHRSHIPEIWRLCHKSFQMALGQICYFGLKISLCTLYPAYTTFKMMKEEDEMVKINL